MSTQTSFVAEQFRLQQWADHRDQGLPEPSL